MKLYLGDTEIVLDKKNLESFVHVPFGHICWLPNSTLFLKWKWLNETLHWLKLHSSLDLNIAGVLSADSSTQLNKIYTCF